MKNLYKKIGTNKNAVIYTSKRKRTNSEMQRFIKDKTQEKVNRLKARLKYYDLSDEEIKEIKSQITETIFAGKELLDIQVMDAYNTLLEDRTFNESDMMIDIEENDTETDLFDENEKDAYKLFGLTKKYCMTRNANKLDEMIKQRKEGYIKLAKNYIKEVPDSQRDRTKIKINKIIKGIEEAYSKIKDSKSRERYNRELEKIAHDKIMEDLLSDIAKYYDARAFYNKELISKKTPPICVPIVNEKMVFYRKDGQKINLIKTGRLLYCDNKEIAKMKLSRYKIKRNIDGKEIENTVYCDLENLETNIANEENFSEKDENYIDYVVNHLLSEESIIACDFFNHGYLGEVRKAQNGKYYTSFENVDDLSAVFKLYENSKMLEKKYEEEER